MKYKMNLHCSKIIMDQSIKVYYKVILISFYYRNIMGIMKYRYEYIYIIIYLVPTK